MLLNPRWVVQAAELELQGRKAKAFGRNKERAANKRKTQNTKLRKEI